MDDQSYLCKMWGLLKGAFVLYCFLSCSTVLLLAYIFIILPFILLSKSIERRLQAILQKTWVYLLLGVTVNAAHSELLVTLPEEGGAEMEAAVLERISGGFVFDDVTVERLKEKFTNKKDGQRDIVIANHQIYMDWIYIWAFMARLQREGTVKIILKRSLLNVPLFGLVQRLDFYIDVPL